MRKRTRRMIYAGFAVAALATVWYQQARPPAQGEATHAAAFIQRTPRLELTAAPVVGSAELSGLVYAAQGAAPIPSARVCASCANCEPTSARASACTVSDAQGRYALPELAAGGYFVTAAAVGYGPAPANGGEPIFLHADELRSGLDIALPAGGARLVGTVLDAVGGTVPYARVRAVRLAPPRISLDVESDETGRFTFWLEPGPVSLIAEAEGYTAARTNAVAPGRGIQLRLIPASSIAGTVVSAQDRAPVADVEVRAPPAHRPFSAVYRAAVSDDAGWFRIQGLAPGSYVLLAKGERSQGHRTASLDLGVAEHLRGVEVVVGSAASVRGRVLVEGGTEPCRHGLVALGDPSPIQLQPKAAGVEARPAGSSARASGPEQVAEIQPDGSVFFPGVPAGHYYASVRCTNHRLHAGPLEVDVAAQPITGLTWSVSAGAALRVNVVDRRGEPLADTPFVLRWPSGSADGARPISAHRSDAHGRFEIAGLSPGTYEVLPGLGSDPSSGVSATLSERDRSAEVTLALAASGMIVLEVADEPGEPVTGLRVTALETVAAEGARRPARQHAVEMGEGRYRIGPLGAGLYQVHVSDGINPTVQLGEGSEPPLRVADGTVTERRLVLSRGGVIEGTALDAAGNPAADLWVSARAIEREDALRVAALSDPNRRVLTDRDGHFTLSGLAREGRYAVRAAEPFGNAVSADDVSPGASITLRLAAPAFPSGLVVDALGQPVSQFHIQALHAGSESQQSQSVSDASGRFDFQNLAPGTIQVQAISPNGEVGAAQLELAPGERRSDWQISLARVDEHASRIESSAPALR